MKKGTKWGGAILLMLHMCVLQKTIRVMNEPAFFGLAVNREVSKHKHNTTHHIWDWEIGKLGILPLLPLPAKC